MKKLILVISVLIICLLVVVYLGLSQSSRFNNFVFTNVVNPYNPLKAQISQPIKKQSQQYESWDDPRGLFPIFAYNVPDGTKDLSASLKIIEKGGINIIINANLGWMPDPNNLRQAFKELGDSDLRWIAILENECKDDFIYFNSNNESNKHIKTYLEEFNDEFVYGWYIWDEPGNNRKFCTPFNLFPNDDYEDIDRMVKQIRSDSSFSKKLGYVNLFPTYWQETPTEEAYEDYIDAFILSQQYKPRVLSFDHYPLLVKKAGGFRKDYFLNLKIIRKKSLEYNIPFWMVVLSSEHLSYKEPTFEEICFQVYSALAYGAKGIGYYLYSKSFTKLGYSSWILEDYVDNPNVADSLHGPLFVPVQELNQNVQKIGQILSKLKSVEVIHPSDYPNKQLNINESIFVKNKPNSVIKEITNNNDAEVLPKILIGVFSADDGINTNEKYLLIVNKDVKSESNVKIRLDKIYSIYKFDADADKYSIISTNQFIDLIINPGDSELIFLE
ncbi:MAG: hypothetical protein OEM46_01915 [Ignavibacteria bacterium]|nr:hypothetical protein [Ignavibacteria bacterium]